MVRPENPFGPHEPPGPHPPYKPPVGKTTVVGSPGFLTSTGGISGNAFFTLIPIYDILSTDNYLGFIDPTNFDTEEDCYYYFRQEDVMPNRKVSVHKLIVTYRELGVATFNLGVVAYIREQDTYVSVQRTVKIPAPNVVKGRTNRLKSLSNNKSTVIDIFPSNKLRTQDVDIIITGERPQLFMSRMANSGPLAISRILMVGKADEKDQL